MNDSGVELEGIKFWGSPVQPEFGRWAFNRARTLSEANYKFIKEIKPHWDMISEDTDVLITHGPPYGAPRPDRSPPYGVLDEVMYVGRNPERNVGCQKLMEKIQKIKPKLHVFGHIHEARGVHIDKENKITYVNASSLNISYRPYNEKPYIFDWDKVLKGESDGQDS